ncbi:MAG: hypothetical protein IPP69_18110 [Flavobacteriales bacterium]|nr:hypothetical protein [Flavobacteriales bacterium]
MQKLSEILPPIVALRAIEVPEDLQKDRWGGKSSRDGFKLDASVVPSSEYSGLYKVTLRVIREDGSPVNHPAAFLVHDSFKLENNIIYASMDGTGIRKLH